MELRLEKNLLRFIIVFIALSCVGYAIGIFYYLYVGSPTHKNITGSNDPALLVVSYDAFRPDYLKRGVTPYMNKFREEGAAPEFMYNVFPTKTFTNHHSLATASHSSHFRPIHSL